MKQLSNRRADLAALAALLVLSLLQHPDLILRGLILADYDVFVYFYPLREYAAQAIRQGHVPLWAPGIFLGSPFLANPQTAVFYPLTALFYALPVPYAYSASLLLHIFLAGALFYLFARRTLALEPVSSLLGALAFMLSGFFAGQVGHLNQFSAAAWLPLLVTAFDEAARRRSLPLLVGTAAVVAIQLLAGHPQETYMSLFVVGIFVLGRALVSGAKQVAWALAMGGASLALGVGLAGVQVLPTLDLARASIRAGGLPYREAVFASLPPWYVPWALLPGFRWNVIANSEFLGYVGVVPVVAGLLALLAARRMDTILAALVALLGVVLAMGAVLPAYPYFFQYVPYFDHFRVPARWLFVYIFAAAALAALGLDWARSRQWPLLSRSRSWARLARAAVVTVILVLAVYWMPQFAEPVPRRLIALWLALAGGAAVLLAAARHSVRWRGAASGLLVAVVAAELTLAPMDLPYRYPVPADAYAMQRDSTSHILAGPGGRVLSVAVDNYEVKETPDYKREYAWLDPRSLLHYLIAVKHNEILTPNLSLVYGVPTADGYDGGLLPSDRFVELSKLLIPPEQVRTDGVWRSRLEFVPSPRLLDLLGIRYVVASKIRDAVVEGIPYDRALAVPLERNESLSLRRLPAVRATALGVVSTFDGPKLPTGTEVARVILRGAAGRRHEVPIRLGFETGYERQRPPEGADKPAALGRWFVDSRWDYLARQPIDALELTAIRIQGAAPAGKLEVKALTLIDDRNQRAYPLVLSDRLERETFFDLKVYQLTDALPRAYLVHEATVLEDGEALQRLADQSFDPRTEVVLAPALGARDVRGSGEPVPAKVERPQPERLLARVEASAPGYLVVTESFASGWRAFVDGQPAELLRANYIFQAVPVPPGEHLVELRYEPRAFMLGVALSGVSLLAAVGLVAIALLQAARRR